MKNKKKLLRDYFFGVRRALAPERRSAAALALANQCSELLKDASLVLSFASFGDEIDLGELNQRLAEEKRLLLPLRKGDALEIYRVEHLPFQSKKTLWEPEPDESKKVDLDQITHILVPGLSFDRRGFRLGYGRGYYDRLLATTKAKTFGLVFKEQLCEEDLPVEPFDERVEHLLLF